MEKKNKFEKSNKNHLVQNVLYICIKCSTIFNKYFYMKTMQYKQKGNTSNNGKSPKGYAVKRRG